MSEKIRRAVMVETMSSYIEVGVQFQAGDKANDPIDFMVEPTAQVLWIAVAQTTSPFMARIHQAIMPHNFKIPYMELAVMCWAFFLTFGRVAKAWHTSLRLGIIRSLKQLENAFIDIFIGTRSVKKPHSYLSSSIQRERKSLKMYVQRFMETIMQIEWESDKQAM